MASIKAHTKVAEFYQRISAATASITAAAAAASVAPTSTPVVDLTSETTTNSSSDTSSGEVPGIITTKVSAFAKAFLKEVPTEDTSNAWIESRNAKTASFKAVVSTYKEKVKKRGEEGDFIDYSQYGTIVQAEGGEGEGAGQEGAGQEGEEERDLRMLQEDEEQEQLMYIIETKNATAAASQRQSKPSAPTSSAKPLLNNQNKAAEGSGGAGAAGNVIGNKFSQFSLPDNEWLDEEPTAAQREKARQAYLKHTAAKTMESTSSALPSSKSPEEMAVVQEDESTTDGFYEIDSEVSNLSCRRTATTAATTSYSTSTTPGMSPAGARSFPLPGNSNSPFPAAVRPSASSMSHSILSGVAQHVNQQPPPPPPATSGPFSNPNHLQNGVCSSVVIDLMDDEEEFSHGASIWGLPAAPVTYKPPQDLAYGSCPVSAVPVRMLSPPPSGSSAPHHQQLYSASFAVGGGAAAATLSWPRAGEFVSGPPGAPFPSSSSRGPPPPSLMKSPAKPPAEASLFQLISGGATGTGSTATGVGGTVLRPFSSANPGNGSTAQMAGNNTSNSSLTGQKIGAVNGCPVVSLSTQPLLAVSAASSGGEAGVHSNSNSLSDEQKR